MEDSSVMEDTKGTNNIVVGQQIAPEKQILAERMRRTMTPTETALWQKLRRNQLGVNFRRQQGIDGFIVDFYCHCKTLVVEVDGPVHDADYDAERGRILAERGLTTLRFTNEQVRDNIGFVLYQIRRHLKSKTR